MTRQTLIRTCPVCGRAMFQKHAETCTGPAPGAGLKCPNCGDPLTPDWVGDPNVGWCSPCNSWNFELQPCECPPGMQHKPDCVEVTG